MESNREITELIESIKNVRNASVISRLKAAFDDILQSAEYELSPEQKTMLDRRIKSYQSGQATTYSLEEVRAKFQRKMNNS